MQSLRRSIVRVLSAALTLVAVAGCGGDDPVSPGTLAGTYVATTFQVTLDGQEPIDVLSHYGGLAVTIFGDRSVIGTLHIPASINGGEAATANMSGTAVVSGGTVQFEQEADTFVRDLEWSMGTNALSVTNQPVGVGVFTIILTRH